jgi:hypothetical protein
MSILDLLPFIVLTSIALTFVAIAIARLVWDRFMKSDVPKRGLMVMFDDEHLTAADFEADNFHEERGDV